MKLIALHLYLNALGKYKNLNFLVTYSITCHFDLNLLLYLWRGSDGDAVQDFFSIIQKSPVATLIQRINTALVAI